WFLENSFLYSLLTHFITKFLYCFLSLSHIFEGCLFNTINELLTLGFGCKYSLGILLNMDISTSVIKNSASERFVFSNLLANPYSTIKLLFFDIFFINIFGFFYVFIFLVLF